MNELQLLEQLQTIINKLKNNKLLDNNEYKLLTIILFSLSIGFMKWAINTLIDIEIKRKND